MVKDHFQRPDGYIHQLINYKARTLCRMWIFRQSDYDDIVQDLWLHLLEREVQFDASRACFETFANRVITNKVRSIIRHRKAAKRNPEREKASLNAPVVPGNPSSPMLCNTVADPRSPSLQDIDHKLEQEALIKRMPEEYREPMSHLLDGMHKCEVRDRFKISRRKLADMLSHAAAILQQLRKEK